MGEKVNEDRPVIREFVPDSLAGERVDRVISFITGASRSIVSKCVQDGEVLCNDVVVRKGSQKVTTGDLIEVNSPLFDSGLEIEADSEIIIPIIHEDQDLIVVDKPSGLVIHPAPSQKKGTLVNGLLSIYPEIASVGEPERPGIVHRLDKGTSGLLVVALSPQGYLGLSEQLQRRAIKRVYTTLVLGHLESNKGVIEAPLGRDPKSPTRRTVLADGKEARTRYEVLDRYGYPSNCSLVRCELETGRTHQIRAHFSAIGHPIVGDSLYGGSSISFEIERPFLHSSLIAFEHPITGDSLSFSSQVPKELLTILDKVQ
ncbi:MAG: RNA pseudouridine synthase [Actinobacteria bacterium]|nr:RNA pseudouridine synthase [Actinomycetota bacterium]|tara:strand:- start:1747 stop:2691 length:945 start_codon:yes stop_codon:yes gene_type:complete